MAFFKRLRRSAISVVRSELCRINVRCALTGAVIMLICGILSAISTDSFTLFGEICRPKFTPPAVVFPVVWTFLYLLIGAAAGSIFCFSERALESCKYKGLLLFVIMAVFNFIWSPLFFGAGAFFAAFLAIIMMIVLTFCIIVCFGKIYKTAAAAMILYLCWLFFAAYLNFGVLILN